MQLSAADADARARRADPEAGVLNVQKSGRYVRVGNTDYPLATPGGHWALWSSTPVEGFRRIGNGWVRNISPDEQLECFRVEYSGTYRGITVTVEPGGDGPDRRGMARLGTLDQRAAEQGFEMLGFERPELQPWLKSVPMDDPELDFEMIRTPEPMPWAATSRDAVAQRPVPRASDAQPSAWGAFGLRLVTALRGVTDQVFLIVSVDGDPLRYVQFAGDPDKLYAEAPGLDVVTDADETVLKAAGWEEPGVGQPNWTSELALPAYAADYREFADRCVAALRDAYRVSNPDVLVHRAWRDQEQTSLEFPGLGRAQL